ncbi:ABC transporter ATP-binding protein [Actinopolymorpha alba]|uniref:ABC transporter ATP-binding protein n=1 Tax=Actinopolymorpha alba TaxID=533267 RepID=UPI000364FF8A|nr:ABC transporter ATP-binding protein [Actinopolymorpha alba]
MKAPDGLDGVPVLEARGLTKLFKVRSERGAGYRRGRVLYAVDGVNLALRPGRSVALVGESGSGKSTVARLLAHLYPITAGEVRLNGRPTRPRFARARRAYARNVQLIFQDPFASLNPTHRIRYQLTRVLRLHGYARGRDQTAQVLEDLLARVQLTPANQYLEKFPHELSGGQLQRVAIARALAARPLVLLADEPVSMLDVSIRLGVLNLLAALKVQERLAILYITHDIASARYFAEETLVMFLGQLVEGGPSEELTQRPAHPYTQLLISSAPDPSKRGVRTEGRPPRAGGRPSPEGCRFAGRCPHTMPVCRDTTPVVSDLGGGHWVRCWLHEPASAETVGASATRPDQQEVARP